MVNKRALKIAAAAISVTAIAIGLGVGLGYKKANSNDSSTTQLSASSAYAGYNLNDYCGRRLDGTGRYVKGEESKRKLGKVIVSVHMM